MVLTSTVGFVEALSVSVRKANEIITKVTHSDFSDVARCKWVSFDAKNVKI